MYVIMAMSICQEGCMLETKVEGFIIKHREGSFDWAIIDEVITNDCYRVKKLHLPNNAVIVDVGAQIGIFSVFVASRYPNAKIFSYEMLKENFKWLEENTKPYLNIMPFNMAVIGDRKAIGCNTHPTNSGGHSLVFKGNCNHTIGNQISIDKIISTKQIDLFKCDCEGSEFDIFKKLQKENMLKSIKRIAMECHLHYGNKLKEITDLLDLNDFTYDTHHNTGDRKLIEIHAVQKGLDW